MRSTRPVDEPNPTTRPAGHVVVSGGICLVGWLVATRLVRSPVAIGGGVLGAWIVQSILAVLLLAALRGGRNATRIWVAGMAVRGAALAGLWLVDALTGRPGRVTVLAFAFTMIVLVLLEAVWLAGTTTRSS